MENMLLKNKVEPMILALGQYIRKRRQSLGMSQGELAACSGLHRTYVSDVERGNRNLTLGATTLLASGLGLRLKDLILAVDHDEQPLIEPCKSSFEPGHNSWEETKSTFTGLMPEQSRVPAYEKQPA